MKAAVFRVSDLAWDQILVARLMTGFDTKNTIDYRVTHGLPKDWKTVEVRIWGNTVSLLGTSESFPEVDDPWKQTSLTISVQTAPRDQPYVVHDCQ